MGTKFTQDVEEGAEEQTLEPRKVWQAETWGYGWNACVVAPGAWTETRSGQELSIERTSQGALDMGSLGPGSVRMASPSSRGID